MGSPFLIGQLTLIGETVTGMVGIGDSGGRLPTIVALMVDIGEAIEERETLRQLEVELEPYPIPVSECHFGCQPFLP